MAEYEYRAVRIPAGSSRSAAKDMLAIHAEYGGWELARHILTSDGRRTVTVRRRPHPDLPPLPS